MVVPIPVKLTVKQIRKKPTAMLYNPAVRSLLQQVVAGPAMGRHALLACTAARNLHMSEQVMEVFMVNNEDDFKNKVMRSTLPVIVNFHAEWCEPCHSLKPLLQKIAEENEGHLHLAEVAVDDHFELLHAFEVTAVPAVLGIHRGMVVEKFVGLVSHKEVKGFVEKLLNK